MDAVRAVTHMHAVSDPVSHTWFTASQHDLVIIECEVVERGPAAVRRCWQPVLS